MLPATANHLLKTKRVDVRARIFPDVVLRWCAIGLTVLAPLGCSDITRVSNPGLASSSNFNNATGASTLRNEAVATFGIALGSQVFTSGIIADEFTTTVPGTTLSLADQRRVAATAQDYPYARLSDVRVWALQALPLTERYSPDSSAQIAQLFTILGYTELLLSEDMCSGVPTAQVTNGQAQYGANLTNMQLLALATSYFDSALVHGKSSDSITTVASIGKARALLDSGDHATAASIANNIPTGFTYLVQFDSAVQYSNPIYQQINLGESGSGASVSDQEGGVGINFITGNDPRSTTDSLGQGVWAPHIYNSNSAPIVLASGIEASLMVAEHLLRTNDINGWVGVLNGLRGTAIQPAIAPLPPDSSTGASSALQLAVMFRERALWLFATGHRQGDLRRLVRQYAQSTSSVFPSGLYHGGPQTYGTDVTYVPYGENFNPGYTGCIDRAP